MTGRRISRADETALARMIKKYGKDAVHAALDNGPKHSTKGAPQRPKTLYSGLAATVDLIAEIHRAKGHPAPKRAAFEEAAALESDEKGRPVTVATIKRYYRLGRAQLRGK